MAQVPNSVPLTGMVAPTDEADTYAVIDPLFGIDGLRSVADTTARDAISSDRRREGMLVYTRSDKRYWQLQEDLASWTEFKSAIVVPPDPSFRWCIQNNIINETVQVGADQTFLHGNTQLGPLGVLELGAQAELKSL